EQAGLQKGDVIVEIAGQTIANIYDYTYALDVLKIGQPAKVVYMRDGKKRETTPPPAARKEGTRSGAPATRPEPCVRCCEEVPTMPRLFRGASAAAAALIAV